MGLIADALAGRTTPSGGEPCVIAQRIADHLDDETSAEVDDYIAAILARRERFGHRMPGGPNAGELTRLLNEIGVKVNITTMRDHIAGRCTCGPRS